MVIRIKCHMLNEMVNTMAVAVAAANRIGMGFECLQHIPDNIHGEIN